MWSKIVLFFRKNLFLIFLIIFTIILRLVPIFPDKFPFMYDHAKDALIILQMGTRLKPSLVGAVTSIPGLYYGPLWYYLALPLNIILNYHPLASVLTVIFIAAAMTYLAWKYLGKLEAVLWATSVGIVGTQMSAWSPYLTTLLMLPLLILLLELGKFADQKEVKTIKIKETKKQNVTINLILLFLLLSISFHLQPAYGIVLLPTVVMILLWIGLRPSRKQWLWSLLAFSVPFLPHLVFELRHNFFQTRQLWAFFKNYGHQAGVIEPNATGLKRLVEIADYTLVPIGQALGSIQFPFPRWELIYAVSLFVLLLYLVFFRQVVWKQAKFKIFSGLILGTFLFYLILPAKPYYFVALIPVWLVLTADLVKTNFPKLVKPTVIIWLILSLFQLRIQYNRHQKFAQDDSFLLASKIDVTKYVYELAGQEPFAVYHFTPEIYDFTYQFIHRYLERQGYQVPNEFSYAPGKTAYLSQVVPELVREAPAELPKNIFLVVERAAGGREFVLDSWWSQVRQDFDIVEEIKFNQALTIHRLKESE